MRVLEVVITSIFVLLVLRLLLQSSRTSQVVGSITQGATGIIGAVVPSNLS